MKKYFDYLDQLRESGAVNMFHAVPYLQEAFPELAENKQRAKDLLTAWMSGFGKAHLSPEGDASGTEAEAIFLFGDFLSDLAQNLFSTEGTGKCALCVHQGSCSKDGFRSCLEGIEQCLLSHAAAYHTRMEECCHAHFSYLDRLQAQGTYDLYSAEQALKEEFPYLLSHAAYAKYIMASWLLKYWG